MPWSSPTLKELIAQAKANIEYATDGASALFARFEAGVSRALGAMGWGLHRHIAHVAREVMLKGETTGEGVELWSRLTRLEDKPASKASGVLDVTSVGVANVSIGDTWTRADGAVYEATEDVAFTAVGGETLPVPVEAVEAGSAGDLSAGATASLVNPIANIEADAVVSTEIDGGEDAETPEAKRSRLLQRTGTAPLGGGPGDWEGWALEVPGITRAWEIANADGSGTVLILVVNDLNDPIEADAATITAAQDYIDSKRPLPLGGRVDSPLLVDLPLTIELSPDTPAIRAAVEVEVGDFLARAAEPGVTIHPSQISEAISIATGEESHVLSVPAAAITYGARDIPVLGTITYV